MPRNAGPTPSTWKGVLLDRSMRQHPASGKMKTSLSGVQRWGTLWQGCDSWANNRPALLWTPGGAGGLFAILPTRFSSGRLLALFFLHILCRFGRTNNPTSRRKPWLFRAPLMWELLIDVDGLSNCPSLIACEDSDYPLASSPLAMNRAEGVLLSWRNPGERWEGRLAACVFFFFTWPLGYFAQVSKKGKRVCACLQTIVILDCSPVGVKANFHSAGNQYREHSGVVVYNQNNDFNQAYTPLWGKETNITAWGQHDGAKGFRTPLKRSTLRCNVDFLVASCYVTNVMCLAAKQGKGANPWIDEPIIPFLPLVMV